MDFNALRFDASRSEYEQQAKELLRAHAAGDPGAIRMIHENHPRFLDSEIVWLPKRIPDSEIRAALLDLADAQLTIARCYSFRDWIVLMEYVEEVRKDGSPVQQFESAAEAIIQGDLSALQSLLRHSPELNRASSSRVTNFDPPVHRATLLHYIAANGVEGYRQKSPANAVEIAVELLEAGADPDALADMYGGQCSTMSLLVSSSPPADAGVQIPLVETLLDYGASVGELGKGKCTSPLMTSLVFGFVDAAETLVRRGAHVDNIVAAAGLGLIDKVEAALDSASPEDRHRALALASQLGRTEIVNLLLAAGEDPSRFNPDGFHAHATPVHHAAHAGHEAIVRLLVAHGARLDIQDKIWRSTPLGWALHGGKEDVAKYLRMVGG